MLKSYLIAALRNFGRNKLNTFINVFGLSIGLAVSVLAIAFFLDETSFDNFHSKAHQIYRLNKVVNETNGSTSLTAETSGMMGPTIVTELPGVLASVRYAPRNNVVWSYKANNVPVVDGMSIFVDSTFFNLFDFTFLHGDSQSALVRPLTTVLTEGLAQRLFGQEDPVGKVIKGPNDFDFEVTGVVTNPPRNSHIQFEALMSWSTTLPDTGPIPMTYLNNWISQALTTYILLDENANVAALQQQLKSFLFRHLPERAEKYYLYLQPLDKLYLSGSEVGRHRMAKAGSRQFIYTFGAIACLTLIVACINFINITTARSTRRVREVGMRKTLGATKIQLINQFIGEAFVMMIIAASVAVGIAYLALPWFNELTARNIPFQIMLTPMVVGSFLLLVIIVTLLAGFYPAFAMAQARTAEVLKSNQRLTLSGTKGRYVLVTFQFLITIMMITGTRVIYKQSEFLLTKDLNFNKGQVFTIPLTPSVSQQVQVYKQEILKHPSVQHASVTQFAVGGGVSSTYVIPEGFPPDEIEIRMFPVDAAFGQTYGLEMAAGRFFDERLASDSNAVIINEALVQKLGWSDAINKTIKFREDGPAYPVIGVVEDFHYRALYDPIEPLVMWISDQYHHNIAVRFSGNPSSLIAFAQDKWQLFENRYPFKYTFADDSFARAYASEERLFRTFMTFAAISIIVACLGLYGLVSFLLEQRIKEFGIRKVLGATLSQLNFLILNKFILMVAIAGVLATPIVLMLGNEWLSKFAYRVTLSTGVVVSAVIATLAVCCLAVSVQVFKVGYKNLIDALKSE
ncbi:MAG TPA: ABC transporter permease [Chryseosolibacter sp.]|nr:ABC transporter permease [Chryseosolibacter sp.]